MGASAPVKCHYSSCHEIYSFRLKPASQQVFDFKLFPWMTDLCGKHSQVVSLAGAAHLLNDNEGVLRSAH